MNLVVLTGRLTREPDLKYGQSGSAYIRFSLAVDRAFKKNETDFISCVAFGKSAELIGEYVKKGHKLGIQGNINTGHYMKDDQRINTFDVNVSSIEFLEGKQKLGDFQQSVVDEFSK